MEAPNPKARDEYNKESPFGEIITHNEVIEIATKAVPIINFLDLNKSEIKKTGKRAKIDIKP